MSMGKKDPKTIGLKEVELNKNYALIISTNGGLWRYLVGDTVSIYFIASFQIKSYGQAQTLYECIWRRSHCRKF